jgi:pimeloyl-ACP methyl ester carboxylesterase
VLANGLIIACALVVGLGQSAGDGAENGASGAQPQAVALVAKVEEFFRTDDSETRNSLASSIADAAHGDTRAVARAIQSANLWVELPDLLGTFHFESTTTGQVELGYALPDGYDPTRRYPTILCMPDEGVTNDETLALARVLLGAQANGFILACPDRRIGGSFHQSPAEAGNLRGLVCQIRRHLHTDTDRTYLFGIGVGGEAAWLAAIAHSDLFAGAITLFSYPRMPYPEQAYPILLGNLRDVPLLSIWRSAHSPGAARQAKVIAAHNRGIVEYANKAALPITGVELPTGASFELPAHEVSAILSHRRPKHIPGTSHWFRYPAQGTVGWLRQSKYAGEPWQGDQLSILASPLTDRDTFIQDVYRANLGYIGGSITGQTITIEARRCARIEILLSGGMIDFAKPVTVSCNGRKRREWKVRPNIKTLLDTAYAEWEVQRLVWARRSVSVRAPSPRH